MLRNGGLRDECGGELSGSTANGTPMLKSVKLQKEIIFEMIKHAFYSVRVVMS